MNLARKWTTVALAAAAASALAIVVPKLSLFVSVVVLIAFLVMPEFEGEARRRARVAFAIAGALSLVGLVRFVIRDVVPSLVGAGNSAQAFQAVSRLREIRFAELAVQKQASVDPDRDGRGSAALIGELTGAMPLRGDRPLDPPLLNESYKHLETTPVGPAVLSSGYYYLVCLPQRGGGFGALPSAAIDEEAAEQHFLAYAWPAAENHGPRSAFVVDEVDRVLVSDNPEDGGNRYAGPMSPPSCNDAVVQRTHSSWRPWQGKSP
jgi:hypothetical protein